MHNALLNTLLGALQALVEYGGVLVGDPYTASVGSAREGWAGKKTGELLEANGKDFPSSTSEGMAPVL